MLSTKTASNDPVESPLPVCFSPSPPASAELVCSAGAGSGRRRRFRTGGKKAPAISPVNYNESYRGPDGQNTPCHRKIGALQFGWRGARFAWGANMRKLFCLIAAGSSLSQGKQKTYPHSNYGRSNPGRHKQDLSILITQAAWRCLPHPRPQRQSAETGTARRSNRRF